MLTIEHSDSTATTRCLAGSRMVVISEGGRGFSSRLYVNHGETATLTSATHKTKDGALRWAAQKLNA